MVRRMEGSATFNTMLNSVASDSDVGQYELLSAFNHNDEVMKFMMRVHSGDGGIQRYH